MSVLSGEIKEDYERRMSEWMAARNARMPRPSFPKLEPDERLSIPMRDSITLAAGLFLPGSDGPWPTVLIRSPYPESVAPAALLPINRLRESGYAVVLQKVRGTNDSEGNFRFFQNEAEDGYDTIEWLASQSFSNGDIGMTGSSFLGSTQWLAAQLRPPHLRCIAPSSPGGMFFNEAPFVGGALFKLNTLTWPKLVATENHEDIPFDPSNPDVTENNPLGQALRRSPTKSVLQEWHDSPYSDAIIESLEHPVLDEWWENIILTSERAQGIDIPILAMTGFHDGDHVGCFHNWELVEANNLTGSSDRFLLIGPWRHVMTPIGMAAPIGKLSFSEDATVDTYGLIIDFFDQYLKKSPSTTPFLKSKCRAYISGSNEWINLDSYPPTDSEPYELFLASDGDANSVFGNGQLLTEPQDGCPDSMPTDHENPVPIVPIGEDCRENSCRQDVLIYTSDALDQDITILGQVTAEIFLSADTPDADLVLRLEEVFPDGTSVNITGELGCAVLRARYHEGFDKQTNLEPGVPTRMAFDVSHVGRTIRAGHCIRIALSGTAHPLIEPNHNTGEDILTCTTRQKVTPLIHHTVILQSKIVLPTIDMPA